LADFELDAGLTYLHTDTAEGQHGIELYRERYLLLTAAGGPLTESTTVDWAAAAQLPLCALVTTMQNRRILEARIAAAGARLEPVVESDTVAALYAHVASGRWSSIIAHTWLHAFGVPPGLCVVPMAEPSPRPAIGLVISDHEPVSIVASTLIEAVRDRDIAEVLERSLTQALSSS
jgi:DNA-binding transcriptional LysR family regulator